VWREAMQGEPPTCPSQNQCRAKCIRRVSAVLRIFPKEGMPPRRYFPSKRACQKRRRLRPSREGEDLGMSWHSKCEMREAEREAGRQHSECAAPFARASAARTCACTENIAWLTREGALLSCMPHGEPTVEV